MPVVKVDLSETMGNPKSRAALDKILGPPGEGAFAACPGDPTDNAPRQAIFYPNTAVGRERYLQHSVEWEALGRNNFFNSVIWHEDALKLKNGRAPLIIGPDIRPLRFPCLWVDLDARLSDMSRELLEELHTRGSIISHSGGVRPDGSRKVHVRLLLEEPMTDVDEFYVLNRWFAAAMGADTKFSPVAWLTLPGSVRFKDTYPGGRAQTTAFFAKNERGWAIKALQRNFKVIVPEAPTGGPSGRDASDLTPEEVTEALPIEIRRMLRQSDTGDGTRRYKQTHKLVRLCAEKGLTKPQALWVLEQHQPSIGSVGFTRLGSQVHACWPETLEEAEEMAIFEPESTLKNVFSGDWLDKQVFPETEWAVPDLIPEGLGMIVAAPKVGKSFLIMNVGLAVAAGGIALSALQVDKRPVFYMALEDGKKRLQRRARKLLGGAPIPAGMHFMIECDPKLIVPTILDFMQNNEGHKPFIIIDTLGVARGNQGGKGENVYAADTAFMRMYKQVAESCPGSTVLFIHHTNKGTREDFMEDSSGSNGLTGSCDFVLKLHRKRKQREGRLHVGGRDVDEREIAMIFDDGHWTIDGTTLDEASGNADQEPLSARQQAAMEFIASCPEGASVSEIATALSTSAGAVSTHLKRLLDLGKVSKKARGVYVSA